MVCDRWTIGSMIVRWSVWSMIVRWTVWSMIGGLYGL